MKRAMILVLPVLLMTFATIKLLAQEIKFADITGTWIGETNFPDSPDKDLVTLVLKKAGDSFTGTIAVGKTKEVALANVTIEDEDTFSFEFSMTYGGNTNMVKVKLDFLNDKLMGRRLMGSWMRDDGSYGSLDLQPKK
jgi:hypothetical protein